MTAASTWRRRLARAAPSQRVPLTLDVLPTHAVDAWPSMLARAFHRADFIADVRDRLLPVLHALHSRGMRIFDSDRARRAFESLPPVVEIFRGACAAEHESREYGICWTTERAVAESFALRHEIARYATRDHPDVAAQLVRAGFVSDSIVLRATVRRDDISGLLQRRREAEVIVLPEHLAAIEVAPDPTPIDLEETCL